MPKMAERVTQNESKPSVLEDFSQKLRDAEGRTPSHDPLPRNLDVGRAAGKLKMANTVLIFQNGKKYASQAQVERLSLGAG